MPEVQNWFLTAAERGNRATELDRRRGDGRAWTEGNLVEPLVHGATYYPRLLAALRALRDGDLVGITDWRGDTDELLDGEGTELGRVLAELAGRGVQVRGLLWRSHPSAGPLPGGAEPAPGRGGQRGRRRDPARRAGQGTGQPAPEAGPDPPPRPRGRRRRLHGRDRPVPRAPRRRAPPRRPPAGADGRALRRPPSLARRAAGDPRAGRRRPVGHLPGALGGPDPARPPQPVAGPADQAGRPAEAAQPAAADAARPGPGRPPRRPGPAHLPGQAAAAAVRALGGAQHRPRLPQGPVAGPPARSTSRTSTCGRRTSPRRWPTRCAARPSCGWSRSSPATPTRTGA